MALTLGLLMVPSALHAQDAEPSDRVEFSFDEAPLVDLVQYVARMTGRRFIVPSQARDVRVTVVSGAPVTRAELYRGFVSVLAMNGFSVVRSGAYERIVPSEGMVGRPTDVVTDRSASRPAHGVEVITYLHHLDDGSLDDTVELLSRFVSAAGHVNQHAPTRTLILTDTAANVGRMLLILRETRTREPDPSIFVEPLHHADAEALAATLRAALPPDEGARILSPN